MAAGGSEDSVKNVVLKECQFVKEEEIARGKWIGLSRITYTDPHGTERTWEAMKRTTRQSTAEADAVVSIPILKRLLHYDCVIVVKQYRPPVHAYTLEFPAGLIDANETSEECAVRELKEETGYTGVAKHRSPAMGSNPTTSSSKVQFVTMEASDHVLTSMSLAALVADQAVSSTTIQYITMEIDGNLPENQNPKPQLDDGEFIEVFIVPLDEMLSRMNEFSKQGVMVDARVYSYAIAMEQTRNTMTRQMVS